MACRFGLGSVTYAQAAVNALSRRGIRSRLVKLAARESKRGCAYGVETDCNDMKKAARVLTGAGISFKEIK
ncbi:MAG: DUF3343 domain-containing protein [Clostridia bacterium]|nr:DUF3343 domain-containing protein [Clostridia bacterium]